MQEQVGVRPRTVEYEDLFVGLEVAERIALPLVRVFVEVCCYLETYNKRISKLQLKRDFRVFVRSFLLGSFKASSTRYERGYVARDPSLTQRKRSIGS